MKPFSPENESLTQYVAKLEATVERLSAERLKLDRRIHNQRKSWQKTWEILEMRAGYKHLPEGVRSKMLECWCARARECHALKQEIEALRASRMEPSRYSSHWSID